MANYITSHQGIAAYLLMQHYQIVGAEDGINKNGKPVVKLEFDIESYKGREIGDEFMNGTVVGNIKQFHDAGFDVRNAIFQAKASRS